MIPTLFQITLCTAMLFVHVSCGRKLSTEVRLTRFINSPGEDCEFYHKFYSESSYFNSFELIFVVPLFSVSVSVF